MKRNDRLEAILGKDLDVRANDGTYDRLRDLILNAHGPSRTTESAAMLINNRRTIMRNPIVRLGIAAAILAAVGLGIVEFLGTGGTSGVVWAEVAQKVGASSGVIFRTRDTGSRNPNDDWPNAYRISWRSAAVSRMDWYRDGQIHHTIYTNLDTKTLLAVRHDHKAYNKQAMSDELVQQARAGWGWSDPQGLLNLVLSFEHHALGQKTIDGVLCEGIEGTGPDGSTGRLWVAVQTAYPVLVEIESVDAGGLRHTGTMDQFRWNVDLPAEGVEPEIPAGYDPLHFQMQILGGPK